MLKQKQLTIEELTQKVLSSANEMQYSSGYMRGFKHIFKVLNKYCTENKITKFSTEVGEKFLEHQYGIKAGTYVLKNSREHRAIEILSDYQNFGVIMLRRRKNRQFPNQFSNVCNNYLLNMKDNYKRDNTILSHKKSLFYFTEYLNSKKVMKIQNITFDNLESYVFYIINAYNSDVARLHIGVMKSFIQYLCSKKYLSNKITLKFDDFKVASSHKKLPSILESDKIKLVIENIDRSSPQGKRDYAIILLAFKLGLRASDIRNLEPTNFNWNNHTISFVQVKTGEPLSLPLPNDVGWAVIDYLKNGRHKSDSNKIFLRMIAPYIPLQNLDNILIKYMAKAKINYKRMHHHGLHTLRHSLATHMLDNNIPITTIQGILGHVNETTTQKYIGISSKQLYQCALEVVE